MRSPGRRRTTGTRARPSDESESSWLVALLLCFFLGYLGIHRFYTGHTIIGLIQLFTLGGLLIWAFIDFIMILVGAFRDVHGKPLARNI